MAIKLNMDLKISEKIIKNSKNWIGTKFSLYSSKKKDKNSQGECDCFGLICGVLYESGFLNFNSLFENYKNKKINQNKIFELSENLLFKEIFYNDSQLMEGKIACFEIEKNFFHLGFINSACFDKEKKLTLIHAFSKIGFVSENFLDKFWIKKIKFLYSVKN